MNQSLFIKGPHNILFILGIVGCLFFVEALVHQMYLDYDFQILDIKLKCEQPLNNRCVYEYMVRNKNNSINKIELDGFMFKKEELEVGYFIKKEKFSFEYRINGENKVWGFAKYHLLILLASFSALVFWVILSRKLVAGKTDR
ncbi:hypothetical protein AAKU58_004405 [Oxalobacteraceae bacterium GrIS 1.18]